MVIAAAIALFVVAVLVLLAIDHLESLRARFGIPNKALLPPLNCDQWTVVALVIVIFAVFAVILALGVVNAGQRIACNARSLSETLKW